MVSTTETATLSFSSDALKNWTPSSSVTCGYIMWKDIVKSGSTTPYMAGLTGGTPIATTTYYGSRARDGGPASRFHDNNYNTNIGKLGLTNSGTTNIMIWFWNLNTAAPLVLEGWESSQAGGVGDGCKFVIICENLNVEGIRLALLGGATATATAYCVGFHSTATVLANSTISGTNALSVYNDDTSYDEIVVSTIDDSTSQPTTISTRFRDTNNTLTGISETEYRRVHNTSPAFAGSTNVVNHGSGYSSTTRGAGGVFRFMYPGKSAVNTWNSGKPFAWSAASLRTITDINHSAIGGPNVAMDDITGLYYANTHNFAGGDPVYAVGYKH